MKSKEEIWKKHLHSGEQPAGYNAMDEYAREVAIKFGQWVTHNDWVYLPSKEYWLNEEQEEKLQPLTDEQLLNQFLSEQSK